MGAAEQPLPIYLHGLYRDKFTSFSLFFAYFIGFTLCWWNFSFSELGKVFWFLSHPLEKLVDCFKVGHDYIYPS